VTVTDVGHRNAADQIDVGTTGTIEQRGAFRTLNLKGQRSRGSLCHMPQKKFSGIHAPKVGKKTGYLLYNTQHGTDLTRSGKATNHRRE